MRCFTAGSDWCKLNLEVKLMENDDALREVRSR